MNKKSFFWRLLILALVPALMLSGCFWSSEDEGEDLADTYEYVTYEGTLQSLGSVKFNPDATHLLRLEDGEVLYVYSDFYNLWDPEFLNQYMEVSGLLIPGDEDVDKDTLSIERLEVLEREEMDSEVLSMITFEGDMQGFWMDYRSDWTLSGSDAAGITFTAPLPEMDDDDDDEQDESFDEAVDELVEVLLDTVLVSSMDNRDQIEIEEWFNEYIGEMGYSLSVVSVDQLDAIKVEQDRTVTYYIDGMSRVFVVTYTNVQEDKRIEYSNLFADMLYSFDVLEDGFRVDEVDEADEVEDENDADLTDSEIGGTNYETIIDDLEDQLKDLVSNASDPVATKYEFVEPDYVYVEYVDGDAVGRILVRHLGGDDFELLATFAEGSVTDWTLVSGTDEASGSEKTSVDAETGQATTILEGYRPMESGTLHFQMQYPSNWYYSRSGDSFYFSDHPADASNALVTLQVLSYEVGEYAETSSGSGFAVYVPRDESSGYMLIGDSAYQEAIVVMAKSIESTI